MRFQRTVFFGLVMVTLLSLPNLGFAVSMEPMDLAEMAKNSSAVVIAYADHVDTEAGNDAIGEQTLVEMTVLQTIWGEVPSTNLSFFLPEGTSTWEIEEPIFADIPGAPKIIPGEKYLLFLRTAGWIDSPFTGFDLGVYRIKEIEGADYPVSETGQCISSISNSIHWGGAIAQYPTYLGPYFNGTRYYSKTKSILDAPGTITDDEGENSYPDDVRYALDADSIHQKLPNCLQFETVIDKLSDILSYHTPWDSFSPKTILTDSRIRDLILAPSSPTAGNVCFDEEVPFSCEALP